MRLFLALILASVAATADAAILDASGLADLLSQKTKEARACGVVYYNGRMTGGAYLPVWTLKGSGPEGLRYAALGFGGEGGIGGIRPFGTLNANLPALSGRLWSSTWAQDHILRSPFPPIWFGPALRAPIKGESFQTILDDPKRFLGIILSVSISGS